MSIERIQEGFEVFISDADKPFGAVRKISKHGKPALLVYVENAGDFDIALDAVTAVHSQKVIVDGAKLHPRLRNAISHAHDSEDPRI